MANYFLTETAQFKPFSYQEMLAPVKAYQDAYNEADEKLNLLLEDAALKAFNFAPQDTAEKAVYDNMMSKLKDASDKLSSGDPTAFKTIREVNKDYRKIERTFPVMDYPLKCIKVISHNNASLFRSTCPKQF